MNAHTTIAAAPTAYDADAPAPLRVERARALAARQLQVLERLAEAGLAVVAAIEREAQTPTNQAHASQPDAPAAAHTPPEPDESPQAGRSLQTLAMAYARAARAVRLTVLAQSKVMRDLEAAEGLDEAYRGGQAERWRKGRDAAAEARKAKVARILRRVARGQDEDAAEAVTLDGIERFDEDVYGDVLSRPLGEIFARICADLGLAPNWQDLSHEAWAEAEAADPRSPFAGLRRAVGAQDDLTPKDTKRGKAAACARRPACPS